MNRPADPAPRASECDDGRAPPTHRDADAGAARAVPELPSRTWRAILALMRHLPQGVLSRALGRLADLPVPRQLRRPILGTFARLLGIDLTEAERPLGEYRTVNALFVRRLRPAVRNWPDDPRAAGSPVDGVVGRFGSIHEGLLVQAKGRWYTSAELLADPAEAPRFDGGAYVTLYLSPRHYHRIHAPCDGVIRAAMRIPGALFPVNAPAVAHIPRLFARNERLICYIDGPLGRVAVVAVGAYNVGRIAAAFDPEWCGGPGGHPRTADGSAADDLLRAYDPPLPVRRAEEIMAFHLGSTVVLLFERGRSRLRRDLRFEAEIRLGTLIALPADR